MSWDFPGGLVVKNSPVSAGDMGSISDPGTKIPHPQGHPSLQATIREHPRATVKTQRS